MIGSDPSLDNVTIGGTPFNVLMQQAIALKTEHLAVDRRRYDSWPTWLRNSLIVSDVSTSPLPQWPPVLILLALLLQETKALRTLRSFSDRLSVADRWKDVGNERYRDEDFDGAIVLYERALGLWEWVETSVADWRRTVSRRRLACVSHRRVSRRRVSRCRCSRSTTKTSASTATSRPRPRRRPSSASAASRTS